MLVSGVRSRLLSMPEDDDDAGDPMDAGDDLVAAAERVQSMLRKARKRADGMITSRATVRERPDLGRALVRLEALVDRANQVCTMARELRHNLKPRR